MRRWSLGLSLSAAIMGFAVPALASSDDSAPTTVAGDQPMIRIEIDWERPLDLLMSYAATMDPDPLGNPAGSGPSASAGCAPDAIVYGEQVPLELTVDGERPGTYSLVAWSSGWCAYYTTDAEGDVVADNDRSNALMAEYPEGREIGVTFTVSYLNMPGFEPATFSGYVPVHPDGLDPSARRVLGTVDLPAAVASTEGRSVSGSDGSEATPAVDGTSSDEGWWRSDIGLAVVVLLVAAGVVGWLAFQIFKLLLAPDAEEVVIADPDDEIITEPGSENDTDEVSPAVSTATGAAADTEVAEAEVTDAFLSLASGGLSSPPKPPPKLSSADGDDWRSYHELVWAPKTVDVQDESGKTHRLTAGDWYFARYRSTKGWTIYSLDGEQLGYQEGDDHVVRRKP